jgi:hypothetical protein
MRRSIVALFSSLALAMLWSSIASASGRPDAPRQSDQGIDPSGPASVVGLPAWDVVSVPSPIDSSLHGVQATAANDVWTVGTGDGATLVEHWKGSSFTVVDSPNRRGRDNILESVDAAAPNDVWAVGHADVTDLIGSKTLIEHWDGSAWTIIPSPSRGDRNTINDLTGVAAVAPDDVWAVGETHDFGPGFDPLLLHWNGTAWRFAKNGCVGALSKIDARSAMDIWAVGGSNTCHFDGHSWTNVKAARAPNPQATVDLIDVTVVGPSDVWAVGEEIIECGESVCYGGEIQHWNGTKWAHVTNDAPVLYGVDALTAGDVYAVGLGLGPAILHFDGRSWADVPDGAELGELFDVEGVGGAWWSAGEVPGNETSPLVERAPAPDAGAVVGTTNVSHAVISWFGPESGTVEADAFGAYQVGGLESGRYTLTAAEPGCQPDSARVKVIAGTTIGQDFHLDC